MPNRVIRESILDSERYWAVSMDARQLFVHLMLLADDLGCVSLAPVLLRRRCFDGAPSDAKLGKLLLELADVDLIRRYESGNGNYALIPRFRQRLQITKPKYPLPPEGLILDDKWLLDKINEINNKHANPTVAQRLSNTVSNYLNRNESNLRNEVESKAPVDKSQTAVQPTEGQTLFKSLLKPNVQDESKNESESARLARNRAIAECAQSNPERARQLSERLIDP